VHRVRLRSSHPDHSLATDNYQQSQYFTATLAALIIEIMVCGIARRISMLERSARGLTADVFIARAEKLARRMGTDYRAVVAKLGNELDDYDLDRLIAELGRMV